MIGVDIIDLKKAREEESWKRKGFLNKLFTKEEQIIINNSNNSFETIWLFWSMKESAYKIWSRKNNIRAFSPTSFGCEIIDNNQGIVKCKNEVFYITSTITSKVIFSVGKSKKEIEVCSQITDINSTEGVLRKKLEELTNAKASEIVKSKTEAGAPRYFYRNKLLTESCSISHHGDYGAFSIQI